MSFIRSILVSNRPEILVYCEIGDGVGKGNGWGAQGFVCGRGWLVLPWYVTITARAFYFGDLAFWSIVSIGVWAVGF